MLQRYEKDVDLCDMNFNMANFWVQVHEILVRFKTQKIAEKICETIGTVSKSADNTEVEGDGFIRVQVRVDISKPLCRGRVISLENGRELWVSFKYAFPTFATGVVASHTRIKTAIYGLTAKELYNWRLNNMVHRYVHSLLR